MRKFSSYGPVNEKHHYCVSRKELVDECVNKLTGDEDGHFFTIWVPRQTGKTWLIEQAEKVINQKYNNKFIVACISMQGFIPEPDSDHKAFINYFYSVIEDEFSITINEPPTWNNLRQLFNIKKGILKHPLILKRNKY